MIVQEKENAARTKSRQNCPALLEKRQTEEPPKPGHPGTAAESRSYPCHIDPALVGQGGALEGRPGSEYTCAGGSMQYIGVFRWYISRSSPDPIRTPKRSSTENREQLKAEAGAGHAELRASPEVQESEAVLRLG